MDEDDEYSLINKITDKIYLGDEDAAADLGILKECKITHVLVCAKEPKKYFQMDFVYKQFQIDDFPEQNIVQYFKEAFSFIDSGKIVFVHCQAGISRSASFVIGYLMWKLKKSFEEVFNFVKEKRKIIDPNDGFIKQLILFDKYLIENGYNVKLNSLKSQLKIF
jgi:atypical dual specificity phosphatase